MYTSTWKDMFSQLYCSVELYLLINVFIEEYQLLHKEWFFGFSCDSHITQENSRLVHVWCVSMFAVNPGWD